jgi:hypothetical protein
MRVVDALARLRRDLVGDPDGDDPDDDDPDDDDVDRGACADCAAAGVECPYSDDFYQGDD